MCLSFCNWRAKAVVVSFFLRNSRNVFFRSEECCTGIDNKSKTTLNNGYLGSRDDEERSEMRYVMRIAEFSESSNL